MDSDTPNTPLPTRDEVIAALKQVEDPELFLDIWFLGLVYTIDIAPERLAIEMTFTSPLCPAGPMLVDDVKTKVGAISGGRPVEVTVVFTPPWEPSDEVKGMLGML
jgi:metal-sulfur cluster biosynthetic enzyme